MTDPITPRTGHCQSGDPVAASREARLDVTCQHSPILLGAI